MDNNNDFLLGQLAATTERLAKGQDEIFGRLVAIEQSLAEKRGERKVAAWVFGAAGGMAGAVVTGLAKFFTHK